MSASRSRWRDRALTLGAVIGSLCLLVAVLCAVLDVRPLVFRSGSMSPSIDAGALAFARDVPADQLKVGDVVSVKDAAGERVTHRIVTIDTSAGSDERVLTLKGDANRDTDSAPYSVTRADRVLLDVPLVGYALSFLRSGPGLFLLGILAAGLVLVSIRPGGSSRAGSRRGGSRRKEGGRRRTARLAVPAAMGLTVLAVAAPAMAAFTDAGKITSSTVSTHTLARPTDIACSLGFLSLSMNIDTTPGPDLRYTYVAEIWTTAATPTQVGTTKTMTTNGTKRRYSFGSADIGSLLSVNTTYEVRVYSTPTGSTSWESSAYRSYSFTISSVLGATVFACGSNTST